MKAGSNLERVFQSGTFALTSELGPPKSCDAELIRNKVKNFKGYVDAVNITDNQTAIVRMSSVAASAILVQEGLEPVMQMTCRDRNRLAMQSDILGAYALGIKNILCLSGDHQKFGNHPYAKNVYDIGSMELVSMVRKMRDDSIFDCGEEMKVPPKMFIGAACNPFGDPFEFRVIRLGKKIRSGADFIQTQAVFDLNRFKDFMRMARDRGFHEQTYFMAGIIPPKSAKALEYMQKEVPGMVVPEELVTRMKSAADPQKEGIKITLEIIEEVRQIEGVKGVHLMPVMYDSCVPIIAEEGGFLPRPTFENV